MILQLASPIPMVVKNPADEKWYEGIAHFVIDYGMEFNLLWVVFLDDTGECWTVANPRVRIKNNLTMERYCDEVLNV